MPMKKKARVVEGNEYIDVETYLGNAGWVEDEKVDNYWRDPENKGTWHPEKDAMRIQMERDVERGGKR